MRLLDLNLDEPARNLALDEALLRLADGEVLATGGSGGFLRFWESSTPFVVLGISGRIHDEVEVEACRRDGVPVLRRGSGGGTVVQGPGCLDVAIVLALGESARLLDIENSYEAVVGRTVRALELDGASRSGRSDLALGDRKFGGSAQKRTPRVLLHHATILYDFDLDLIERYLKEPRKQPEYRRGRAHRDFVTNIPLDPKTIRQRIAGAWNAGPLPADWTLPDLGPLLEERYANRRWIERW